MICGTTAPATSWHGGTQSESWASHVEPPTTSDPFGNACMHSCSYSCSYPPVEDSALCVSSRSHHQAGHRAAKLGREQAPKAQAKPRASFTLLVSSHAEPGAHRLAQRRCLHRTSSTGVSLTPSSLIGLLPVLVVIGCLARNGHSTLLYGNHAPNVQYQ